MSFKQPQSEPPPIASAILEFGRLLHEEDQRRTSDHNPTRVLQCEEQLIMRLTTEKNTLLKPAFDFTAGRPIDPLVLRVLSLVAYLQLCTPKSVAAITDVAKAASDGEPAKMLEARRTVTRLLLAKRLVLRENHSACVELGESMHNLLGGGKEAVPITITEWELERRWQKTKAQEAKRKASDSFQNLPTAKQIAAKLAESVIGLDPQVRTFACRVALHQRRAAMIRAGKDPGSPNESLLFVGASGTGKTWLAETAGRVCGLPYAATSATDMSATGYVGLDVDDAIKAVIVAANHDVETARYGIALIDEIDKKRSSGWEHGSRDVAGASVQQGLLRLIEGCEFQVGGRKGSFDWVPTTINTRGMFFVLAGAFVGLEELIGKHTAHGIGFGNRQNGSQQQQFLYDCLVEYGMIPELINRLTGVLVFPEPTVEQLIQIGIRAVLPAYQKLLTGCGADIRVTADGIRLMAACAAETGTFARGVKTIIARLIEDAVYEQRVGVIQFGATEVRQAIEAAGLASTE